MEAMAMEIACITTAITGVPELILNGQNGLLVPASDSEGLTKAIRQLVSDSDLRQQLGKAGRQTVLADYDLYKNVRFLYEKLDQRLESL
jgi:glycosyltransferase involved in cell wall biosynthesis